MTNGRMGSSVMPGRILAVDTVIYRTQDEFAAHFVRLFGVNPFVIGPRHSLTHCRCELYLNVVLYYQQISLNINAQLRRPSYRQQQRQPKKTAVPAGCRLQLQQQPGTHSRRLPLNEETLCSCRQTVPTLPVKKTSFSRGQKLENSRCGPIAAKTPTPYSARIRQLATLANTSVYRPYGATGR